MNEIPIRIVLGPDPETLGPDAIRLLSGGRGSMRFFLGDNALRRQVLAPRLRWQQVIVAIRGTQVVGFAAFKCNGRGGPYAPSLTDFTKVHGRNAWWRWLGFWLVEARDIPVDFYLYGVKVDRRFRGLGIARMLLDAVSNEARRQGAQYVELEVTENHPRAQDVYARYGFLPHRVLSLGWLGRLLRFSRVTVMRLSLH